MQIKQVEEVCYTDDESLDKMKRDVAQAKIKDSQIYGRYYVTKARKYVLYKQFKATKAVEIIPDIKDCDDIYETIPKRDRCNKIMVEDIIKYAYKKHLLKLNQCILPYWFESGCYTTVFTKVSRTWKKTSWIKDKFYLSGKSRIVMFDVNDFKPLPPSNAQIKAEETKRANNFMGMCLKENLKALAKEDGIHLTFKNTGENDLTGVYFADKKSYNKVVMPALQSYLSNLVNKLGGKLVFPERKDDLYVDFNTRMFKLLDVKIDDEHENNN